MNDFNDRPLSVYDNLSASPAAVMYTSTPRIKTTTATVTTGTTTTTTTTTAATATATTNGTCSPYDEITFKFAESNNNDGQHHHHQHHHHHQQQHQHMKLYQRQRQLLPNGAADTTAKENEPQPQLLGKQCEPQQAQPLNQVVHHHHQHHPQHHQQQQQQQRNHRYEQYREQQTATTAHVTPASRSLAAAATTVAPSPSPSPSSAPALVTVTAIAANATMACDLLTDERPFSQHSPAESNEAAQNIAAVKAALNDAKSKFFGLNGYAPEDTRATLQAYNNNTAGDHSRQETTTSKDYISVARVQPMYQNIPENSVAFRQQQQQQQQQSTTAITTEQQQQQLCNTEGILSPPSSIIAVDASQSPELPGSVAIGASATSTDVVTSPTSLSRMTMAKSLSPTAAYRDLTLKDIEGSQPSQAVYMSTTVPQNIKGSKIAGRHTPTRNSLRHSRMLVINNKTPHDETPPNPMAFKHPNLARWLLILQTVMGVVLILLAVWIFFLAPSMSLQDNPYWNGLVLLLAGSFGLLLVRFQRIKRHKIREHCFVFLRADSYLLSLVATLLCLVALICAVIHFARLTANDTHCRPADTMMEFGSCRCTFNVPPPLAQAITTPTDDDINHDADTDADADADDDDGWRTTLQQRRRSYAVEYRDLNCLEVTGVWTLILALSIGLNAFAFVISLLYITLLACCRHKSRHMYSSVQTSNF